VVIVGVLLFFPGSRAAIRHTWHSFTRLFRRKSAALAPTPVRAAHRAKDEAGFAFSKLWARRYIILLSLFVLALPIAFVFLVHDNPRDKRLERQETLKLQALLGDQNLMPPQAMDNGYFATPEVNHVRPAAADASRDWNLLDPDLRQRLLFVYRQMRQEHGIEMVLLEGWRSAERQTTLLQKRVLLVSDDPNLQHLHREGLAADSAFLRNGKIVLSDRDPWARDAYQKFGKVAERVGLTWGGRWKKPDLSHVELHR
jgi:peptidoglycan L-alanyl-D-glutamate endopeptidase CwlK